MNQVRTLALSLALIAFVTFLACPNVAQTRELNLGGLIVSVSDSRTAQVFTLSTRCRSGIAMFIINTSAGRTRHYI